MFRTFGSSGGCLHCFPLWLGCKVRYIYKKSMQIKHDLMRCLSSGFFHLYLHQPSYAHHESTHSHLLILHAQGGLVELSPDGGSNWRCRRPGQRWRSHHANISSCLSSYKWGSRGAHNLCHAHSHSHYTSMSHEAEESGLHTHGAGQLKDHKAQPVGKKLNFKDTVTKGLCIEMVKSFFLSQAEGASSPVVLRAKSRDSASPSEELPSPLTRGKRTATRARVQGDNSAADGASPLHHPPKRLCLPSLGGPVSVNAATALYSCMSPLVVTIWGVWLRLYEDKTACSLIVSVFVHSFPRHLAICEF